MNASERTFQNNGRIAILDGFRALAIISVILYHYFYKWNDGTYPYFGNAIFHQGFRGVPFFFMISGFVICNTLETTSSFILFWKKRLIRLFPSLLIASIITYLVILLFDSNNIFADSHHFRNLLVSISFLPPNLFNWIFGMKEYYSYINSDYWSLWPEIQFYFFSSCLYFSNKIKFNKRFIIISLVLIFLFKIIVFFKYDQILLVQKVLNLFNIFNYLPFFLAGALFYLLYAKRDFINGYLFFLLLVFITLNSSFSLVDFIFNSIMYGMFLFFIFAPKLLHFLENKIIIAIGVSSYFLYLIHDYIGTVWIKNIVMIFYPYSFIAPILILIIMIIFSILYTKHMETIITKFLKNKLNSQNKKP